MQSVVANGEKYLDLLSQLLNNAAAIRYPRSIEELVVLQVSPRKGLIGWLIENKEIRLEKSAYLDCDEVARKTGDTPAYRISRFSYHFHGAPELMDFRIDLRNGDLHVNPDDRAGLPAAHLRPGKGLHLDVDNFNLFLAIHVVWWYLKRKQYPLNPKNAQVLNRILGRLRRRLASG
ncbi:MAG: hypothetical protein QME76_12895 [Bacillota bacterium]|nr:hypothetical protein [Bacillota bacterium]